MNSLIYYITILYAFLTPLSRGAIVGTSALLILLWIIEGRWREKWEKLKSCRVFQAFAIFIIFNLLSLLWSDEVEEALKYISKYWYFLTIFVIYTSFPRERSRDILIAFIFGMLISEILSYGILFEFWELKHGTPDDPTPFMNHLDYSIFLAVTSLTLLIRSLHSKTKRERILLSIFFITVTGNLFVIAGRSGQLAFGVTLLILMFIYFNRSVLKSLTVGGLIFLASLSLPIFLSDTFQNRVEKAKEDINRVLQGDYNSSLGNRVGAWEVAGMILKDNFLIGVGNQDNIAQLKIITTEKEYLQPLNWFGHFHNQYLQILTALGVVGLVIFLNIFLQIYKLPLKEREDNLIKISFLTIFLVGFIAEPFLHKQFPMALFAIFTAYILKSKEVSKSSGLSF